jgi:uncharacterized membrane protein YphA (DoxX/SURF4 family)
LLTVLVLIGLRLALGCHFLYEGVWKITHSDEFHAETFLLQAKGPVAGLFYMMLPDINGRERLHVVTDSETKKKSVDTTALANRWNGIQKDFVAYYRQATVDKDTADKFANDANSQYKQSLDLAQKYLDDNVADIDAHFAALDRFEGLAKDSHQEVGQDAPFQKKRNWDKMLELRHEADAWIKEIESLEKAYKNSLYSLLNDDQKAPGLVPRTWNILAWGRTDQINFAVTYALSAIGLCLMLGLCSRLAALGGAAFMCFVVMTQPAFPTIYPPDPAVVGHALLINKDFIELMALLVIASVPAGRWAGLDFFLYHIFWGWWNRGKSKPGQVKAVANKN